MKGAPQGLRNKCIKLNIPWNNLLNCPERRNGLRCIIEVRLKGRKGQDTINSLDKVTLQDGDGKNYIVYCKKLYEIKEDHCFYIEIVGYTKPKIKTRSKKYDI